MKTSGIWWHWNCYQPLTKRTKFFIFIEFNNIHLLAFLPLYRSFWLNVCWFLILILSYATNFCVLSINKTHLCRQQTANSRHRYENIWQIFNQCQICICIYFCKCNSNQLNAEYFTLSSRLHVITHITNKPIQNKNEEKKKKKHHNLHSTHFYLQTSYRKKREFGYPKD